MPISLGKVTHHVSGHEKLKLKIKTFDAFLILFRWFCPIIHCPNISSNTCLRVQPAEQKMVCFIILTHLDRISHQSFTGLQADQFPSFDQHQLKFWCRKPSTAETCFRISFHDLVQSSESAHLRRKLSRNVPPWKSLMFLGNVSAFEHLMLTRVRTKGILYFKSFVDKFVP